MSRILGIDLGTTNSCMAIMEGGEPVVIPNAEGARTTPSVVAFTKSGERLVGQAAKRQAVTNPRNTVFSAKRFIGRKFTEVREEAKNMQFKTVEGKNGDAYNEVKVGDKTEQFAPQQISAFVLAKMKADAEAYLGEKITQAVITVPAYFTDSSAGHQGRRKDCRPRRSASSTSPLPPHSPTASTRKRTRRLRSSTSAAAPLTSVLEIGDGVFEVKATNGDTHLGGDNWDEALITWLVDNFKKENGIDLRKDPMALQRLKEEAEKAKIALSSAQSVDINLPFITADATGPKHLNVPLSRAKMEQICDALFERCIQPFKNCLKDADLTAAKIDELVLVGGMTRMPKVVEIAHQLGGKPPHQGSIPMKSWPWRRRAGRRSQGRSPRRAPARRYATHSRHRDGGPGCHGDDSAQHHDSFEEDPDLLDLQRESTLRRDCRAAGRAADVARQQDSRYIPPRRNPAGATRRAADRGHLRH